MDSKCSLLLVLVCVGCVECKVGGVIFNLVRGELSPGEKQGLQPATEIESHSYQPKTTCVEESDKKVKTVYPEIKTKIVEHGTEDQKVGYVDILFKAGSTQEVENCQSSGTDQSSGTFKDLISFKIDSTTDVDGIFGSILIGKVTNQKVEIGECNYVNDLPKCQLHTFTDLESGEGMKHAKEDVDKEYLRKNMTAKSDGSFAY